MFYYISFLRPPPSQAQPSRPIPITPQIANDLRTEYYGSEQDLFYSWHQIPPISVQMKPKKLTTWRQTTAWKDIHVPAPPDARDGQLWRLVLTCSEHPASDSIELGSNDLGSMPFPVLSMPIRFVYKIPGKGAVPKQEKIERLYTFRCPLRELDGGPSGTSIRSTKVVIKITEQTSFDLDKKIWDSGIGLSSWLVDLSGADLDESLKLKRNLVLTRLRDALFANQPRCIIELGAGTGIAALTIGALRGALASPGDAVLSHIITTDLESAMPLLEHNIDANAEFFPENTGTRPTAMVLDWDDDVIPAQIQNISRQRGLDAIVMADVTYNTASFPSLVRTLSKLTKLCEKPPLMLLGYKERDGAERTLWEMVQQEANIGLTLVDQIEGAGGAPIEIWIGHSE